MAAGTFCGEALMCDLSSEGSQPSPALQTPIWSSPRAFPAPVPAASWHRRCLRPSRGRGTARFGGEMRLVVFHAMFSASCGCQPRLLLFLSLQ